MKTVFKNIVVRILTAEAKLLLKRHKPTIVAVTGSVGKTSTKDAIYTVLKDSVRARKNKRSMNSEIGVPLTVLGLQNAWSSPLGWLKNIFTGAYIALFTFDYPEVLVLEVGVDHPGDIKRLTSWITPDVVVLTRLPDVPTHVEFFNSPEAVAEEKLALVRALSDHGVFIYNNDDERVRRAAEDVRQQSFGFSRYSPSHFEVRGDKILYDGGTPIGLSFEVLHLEEAVTFNVKDTIGLQHTYNCAAAVAVGHHFDVSLSDAAKALKQHVPPPGRMRLIPGLNNSLIIDDTYNSSPVASERALLTLGELRGKHRKIAVIGDMLELGQYSVREHERIGELVPKVADALLTIGVRARGVAEAALENGLSEKVVWQYDDPIRAADELVPLLEKGDVVLVKASQSIRAEKIVEQLMAQPEMANSLLVRQDWPK